MLTRNQTHSVTKKSMQSYHSVIESCNVANIGTSHAWHLVAWGIDMWDKLSTCFSTFIFLSFLPAPSFSLHLDLTRGFQMKYIHMPISSSILMLIVFCHTDGLLHAKWSGQFSFCARPWHLSYATVATTNLQTWRLLKDLYVLNTWFEGHCAAWHTSLSL